MRMTFALSIRFLVALVAITFNAAAAEQAAWPGLEYAYVKAYLFDGTISSSIVIDGNINPFVEKVARLSATQVPRINNAIQPTSDDGMRTKCYAPHHAFVYFDNFGRPVASMAVCYHCSNYVCAPPLPKGRILNLPTLLPLFKDLSIPVPRSKEFEHFVKSGSRNLDDLPMRARLGFLPENAPESAKHWPWKEARKVKLFEFDRDVPIPSPLVHLGKVTETVNHEVTLTDEQRITAWKCCAQSTWTRMNAQFESKQIEGGQLEVRPIGSEGDSGRKWNQGEPHIPRHGLVCFDEDERPFAWLTISFSDGTYEAYPHEGPKNMLNELWQVVPLRKVFEDAGVPILKADEYERLRKASGGRR